MRGGRAVLTHVEFERRLALEVLGPNQNEGHAALRMPPLAAWRERAPVARLPADRAGFLLDFLPSEPRFIRRAGGKLFNRPYQDGAGASHRGGAGRGGAGRLRVNCDPCAPSAAFVEMPTGGHARVPYADLRWPQITLCEHRRVERALCEANWRPVNESAIFAAVEEIRRGDAEATRSTRAARRAVQRDADASATAGRGGKRRPQPPGRPTRRSRGKGIGDHGRGRGGRGVLVVSADRSDPAGREHAHLLPEACRFAALDDDARVAHVRAER